jgi:predicted dehydrogenase
MKRLALIGCGLIGEYHLNHLKQFNDIELVGFCDIIQERAETFAEKAGKGKAFTCFMDLYNETKPDMLFVCIPPYAHGDIEREAIKRGIHMFIEKPVTLDMELAKEISKKIKENNIISAVGFQCRYDNINVFARDYVNKNDIVTAYCTRVGGMVETPWFRDKKLSGGQLVEQSIHQIDMLRYLLGDAESVYSVARRGFITEREWPGYDVDDLSTSIITFKNGVSCTVMTGIYSLDGASWDSKIILGTRDSRLDFYLASKAVVYGLNEAEAAAEVKGVIKGDGTQRRNEGETGLACQSNVDIGMLCDRTFVDAVLTGDASKILSPYEDAVKTLAIVLSCNKSMDTGLPVKV